MSIDFEGMRQREENPTHGDKAADAIARARQEVAQVLEVCDESNTEARRLQHIALVVNQIQRELGKLGELVRPYETVVEHEVERREMWNDYFNGY